jgi:hypothetical protein
MEPYDVYGAVADTLFRHGEADVAVAPTTSQWSPAGAFGDTSAMYLDLRDRAGVPPAVWGSFQRANRATVRLCDCFGRPGVHLESGADSVRPAPLPGGERWAAVHFSGVGYNARGDTALVFAAQNCGPLCGASYLLLMTRRGRAWTVAQRLLVGAS